MAELRNHNGRPAIYIDGKPYPPMMATIRTMKDGKEIIFDKEYFRNLGKSGIKIYFLICDTLWIKPNAIELFEKEALALLEVVPDAYIIPRIGMHPTNEWIKENPDECVRYSDGSSPGVHLFSESYELDIPAHYSLASEKWRIRAGEALRETWAELMKLPYADRIIGCFFAAGGTSEWYYMLPVYDDAKKISLDYSKAFKREFVKYLRDKYGTDENLQKHWKNPNATIENPPIPEYEKFFFAEKVDHLSAVPDIRMYTNNPVPPAYTNGTNRGAFVDFDKNPDVYDFLRTWHIASSDAVLHFGKVIKDMTPDKLCGAFYGSQGCTSFNRSGSCGGTVQLLESPYVDFLAAPGVYENRMQGGSEGQRQVQDSFAINGKIYIVEEDTRTLAENRYFMDRCQIYDMTDSLNIMKREFGRTICEDVQAWWFDQLIGGRRYKFPEIYDLIAKQQAIAHEAYSLNREKKSEIALIFDEETMQGVSFQTSRDAIELFRNYEMARIGAPVDQYYHNDMTKPDMPSYKLYIFVNTYLLTKEEREAIKAKIKRDGAVALWLYAPGFIDPVAEKKMSAENMKDLTGFDFEVIDERYDAMFRWNGESHEISASFDKRALYGKFDRRRTMMLMATNDPISRYDTYLYPFFKVTDKDARHLAYTLTTKCPAVSIKESHDGFTSVYYASKCIKSEVVREIARFAGCHIYTESDEVLYANNNYVTLHADSTGKKVLRFKEPCSPYEVYEKKFYGQNVTEIEFDAYLGETKMFRLIRDGEKE